MRRHKKKLNLKVRDYTFSLLLISFCLINFTFGSFAQSTSSPYSRYGIGDINDKNTGQSMAMGGANIAVQNDTTPLFFINSNNPASYTSARLTSAEIGLNFNSLQLQSSTSKSTVNSASLGYWKMAFPLKRWWGLSFGLMPYSAVGYNVTSEQTIANVGNVYYQYQGQGGVNQIYLGNAIKPLYGLQRMFLKSEKYDSLLKAKNYKEINRISKRKKAWQALSIGCNISYLFGTIQHSQEDLYYNNAGYFNLATQTSTRFGDIYFDYGLQYSITLDSIRGRVLRDKVKLFAGLTFAAQTDVRAKIDSLSNTYYTDNQGYNRVNDTIVYSSGTKGTVRLPLSFGGGLGFKKGDRWFLAADFAVQNWSSYQAFNQTQGLKNSMRVSLGAQWIPDSKSGQGYYLKRIHYRAGLKYEQTSLYLENTQLTERAITFGLGFPIGRNYLLQNFSMTNVSVEFGQLGTTNNNLVQENYFKISFGITINDHWFVKPRYD